MTVAAATVTPRLNDMMLPLIVINVIPQATSPTKEIPVNREVRLGTVVNPGVARAIAIRTADANARAAVGRGIFAKGKTRETDRVVFSGVIPTGIGPLMPRPPV